jgi:molecular chaperone DnaJ
VRPHPLFERDGYDIIHREPIDIARAALGGTLVVPTLDGEAEITIPPGTEPGDVVRLKGRGIPHLGSKNQRGDHQVSIVVEVPKSLSDEQRMLLERLALTFSDRGAAPSKDGKSWLGKIKDTLGGSE